MEVIVFDGLRDINAALWLLGNLLLAYTSIVLVLFVVSYGFIFDPRATTGGKLIYQFMLSLAGVLVLVFVGIYVDPINNNSWMKLPDTVDWWRPALRLLVYGFVAYSITSLVVLLVMRKWFPHKLKKASDLELVHPRSDTAEIPVVRHDN